MPRSVFAVLAFGIGLSACGSPDTGTAGGDAAPAAAASAPAATATAVNRCPLTAEQVSQAVGGTVTGPDSSCSFFPPEGTASAWPNAAFVLQSTAACAADMRAAMGFKESLDGLGVTAYAADMADGSWVLVCRDGAPFEIRVDRAGAAESRQAAVALARKVLAMR
jgi:hypothetical protein